MQRIVTQAGRAREIVQGLLDFARQRPPRVERADLNRIIMERNRAALPLFGGRRASRKGKVGD